MVNGTADSTIITIEQQNIGCELDAWDDAIRAFDEALMAVYLAKLEIEEEQVILDRIEASYVLRIEGGNAETRKARLTLDLADDDRYEAHRKALLQAREQLWRAERKVVITKERCRLLRATVMTLPNGRDDE